MYLYYYYLATTTTTASITTIIIASEVRVERKGEQGKEDYAIPICTAQDKPHFMHCRLQ
jgi:hypothetical protein